MRLALISLLAATGLAGIGTATFAGLSPVHGETVAIEVGNLYFCDVTHQEGVCDTAVTAGDTVTWNNVAGFHNVTECDESFSTCPPPGGFDSGPLPSGNTYSHRFDSPGTFEYFCSFHPTDMRGRIIVEAGVTPTPTPTPTASPRATSPGATATATTAGSLTPAAIPRTGGPLGADTGPSGGALASAVLGGALLAAGLIAARWDGRGIRR